MFGTWELAEYIGRFRPFWDGSYILGALIVLIFFQFIFLNLRQITSMMLKIAIYGIHIPISP